MRDTQPVFAEPLYIQLKTPDDETILKPPWPRLSCRVENEALLEGTKLRFGNRRDLSPGGTHNWEISSVDDQHRLAFKRVGGVSLDLSVKGPMRFLTGDTPSERLCILANGDVGIGTAAPENSEGWNRVLDLQGVQLTKFSVRTNTIDARVMAHELQWGGAPAGMTVGTKGNHRLSLVTNAAARLTILENGNVGIGTTTPFTLLTMRGSLGFTNSATPMMYIFQSGNNNPERGIAVHSPGLSTSGLFYNDSSDQMIFKFNGAPTLTIGGGGVGIGTTMPNKELTIESGDGAYLNVRSTAVGGPFEVQLGADSSGGIVSTMTNHDLQLRAGGGNDPKLVIKASGYVGIGTTDPGAKLEINGGDLLLKAKLEAPDDPGDIIFQNILGDQNGRIRCNMFGLFLYSANPNPITINSAGSLGIGTTDPGAKLEINDGDLLFKGPRGNPGSIIFRSTDNRQKGRIWFRSDDGEALFLSSRDDRPDITIDTEGRVGIGTETPGAQLEIDGDLRVWGQAYKRSGGSWVVFSDLRLKRKIEPLTGALEKLLQLRGVCFEWIEPEKMGNQHGLQRGLIAQEVEPVFPEWISTDTDGYKLLAIKGFEALMIEALRELKSEIESLKAQHIERAVKRPYRSEGNNR